MSASILSLPSIGLYYGLHDWTERMFGFGARSIAIIDTAAASPFAQLRMIPLLTLIAFYAPAGHRATWFALMASLMNLALVAGQLQTKYLNQMYRGRARRVWRARRAADCGDRDRVRAADRCYPVVRPEGLRPAALEKRRGSRQVLQLKESFALASHDIPVGASHISLADLSERSRDIFRQIVESYLATGEPVGSRNISRLLQVSLSPASVRNVMSDLEQLGLIYAPHTSAGRLPTELGLRFFVDALMQIGDLHEGDKRAIEAQVAGRGQSYESVLTQASGLLSGLTRAAGVVLTAKINTHLKHIEFVRLEPERALVVMVAEDGQVENRILHVPARAADLVADRGVEFSQFPHPRQDAGGSCASNSSRRWKPAAPNSISSPRRSWPRGLQAGRAATMTTAS